LEAMDGALSPFSYYHLDWILPSLLATLKIALSLSPI